MTCCKTKKKPNERKIEIKNRLCFSFFLVSLFTFLFPLFLSLLSPSSQRQQLHSGLDADDQHDDRRDQLDQRGDRGAGDAALGPALGVAVKVDPLRSFFFFFFCCCCSRERVSFFLFSSFGRKAIETPQKRKKTENEEDLPPPPPTFATVYTVISPAATSGPAASATNACTARKIGMFSRTFWWPLCTASNAALLGFVSFAYRSGNSTPKCLRAFMTPMAMAWLAMPRRATEAARALLKFFFFFFFPVEVERKE